MSERAHIQFRGQEANLCESGEGVRRTFSEDLNSLYKLSFLLTSDHETAERCFVAGLHNLIRGNRAFNQWAHAWAKRIVIENAIRELKPQPCLGRSNSSATVFPYCGELSTPPGGHFELKAILSLKDFERFVFVMSVLDHYSEHDCSVLLDCSPSDIREARTRALERLIDSIPLILPHDQVLKQEMK
jgi:DNA-directed RNA polymerase specialized sigma24 family protein